MWCKFEEREKRYKYRQKKWGEFENLPNVCVCMLYIKKTYGEAKGGGWRFETTASVNVPQTFPSSPAVPLGPHWTSLRRSSGRPPPPSPPLSSQSPTCRSCLQGTCLTSCYLQNTQPAGWGREESLFITAAVKKLWWKCTRIILSAAACQ